MRHQVYLRKVEVGIQLLGIIYLLADIIPLAVHFLPLLGRHPSFSICFLVSLSLVHEFRSQGIRFGLRLFAGSSGSENIFQSVKPVEGVLHVAQSCIIVRSISSIQIEFWQCPCALNYRIDYRMLSGASALYRLGYNSKQVPAHFFHLLPIPLRNLILSLILWCEVVVSRHG
jgi:hypothetical protein